jgi:conjugal transfer mating pair stabilization protein TraG
MGMTVITYGGSTFLHYVFNAIAMLMNHHQGGIVTPLMRICAAAGCVWAVAQAFASHSFRSFIRSYIFPLIAISSVFLIPTCSVHIEDVLKDRSYKVDHVPFLLAKFSELASSIGYRITVAFETAMHVPNDLSYNKTGMLFGAENALDIDRFEITNANLEQNLKRFCHHCMLYDVSLGRYSLNDLKTSTDLWKFLEERTSKVRCMQFISLDPSNGKHETSYLSCQEAIRQMTPYFDAEKRFYGKQEVLKNLPLTFQAITGIQKEKEELIGQQLMMHLLSKEMGGEEFAKSRAYTQQKGISWTLGSLATNSLINLRGVLEALVYAAFILIFPLSVLPKGIKYITTWAGLVMWIQLWPPFYAILNYIMQLVAQGYAENLFGGVSGIAGLSFFSSMGIRQLQEDIFAVSGCLAASIPFITYAILKGGVSSFVHLAGSMMSPAHSAAAAVASEQATGNFSFANASLGQISYQNTHGLQTQMAPSLSSGYFTENTGGYGIVHSSDSKILSQGVSSLRTSVYSDGSIIQSQQKMQQHALSTTETAQKNYLENLGVASREFTDLVSSLGNANNYSEGISTREANDIQESTRFFENTAENYGHQFGMSVRESFDRLMHAGLSISGGIGGSFLKVISGNFSGSAGVDWKSNRGSSQDEAWSAALNIAQGEEFQKHLQHIQDISETKSHSFLKEEALRHSEGFNHSLEKTKNTQDSIKFQKIPLGYNRIHNMSKIP